MIGIERDQVVVAREAGVVEPGVVVAVLRASLEGAGIALVAHNVAPREVPHAVAVTLDSIQERNTGLHVAATIHVEKPGQRSILVGRGGEMIKEIGTLARQRLAQLAEHPVHLTLFVRVTERWRNVPRQLAELGYSASNS